MGWVRVSDDFYDHDRFAEIGPLGIAVWITGLAYCNRNLTDGRIPKRAAQRLMHIEGIGVYEGTYSGRDAEVSDGIAELVDAELWLDRGRDYLVRDYLDYQPSRDEVEEQRRKNAIRQDNWRKKNKGGVSRRE